MNRCCIALAVINMLVTGIAISQTPPPAVAHDAARIAATAQAQLLAKNDSKLPPSVRWQGMDFVEHELWPGQSLKIGDRVEVSWSVDPVSKASGTRANTTSTLVIKSPDQSLPPIMLPPVHPSSGAHSQPAYLDEWALIIAQHPVADNNAIRGAKVIIHAKPQPQRILLPGSAWKFNDLYVSQTAPVQLEEWTLRVSDNPVTLPDGSNYHQITATAEGKDGAVSIPLTRSASARFGRFEMKVGRFGEETLTAQLEVNAAADPAPRGAETLIEQLRIEAGETYEQFLSRVAAQHDFNVTWEDFPGKAGSATRLKSMREAHARAVTGNSVMAALSGAFQPLMTDGKNRYDAAELEWRDRHNVIARPSAIAVWQWAATDQREQELERVSALFARDYSPQHRVYALDRIDSKTARDLVQAELSRYALLENLPSDVKDMQIVHDGEAVDIARARDEFLSDKVTSMTREYAVLSENEKQLHVAAIPATHAHIEKLLKDLSQIVATEAVSAPANRHRVQLILLKGGKTAAARDTGERESSETKVLMPGEELRLKDLRLQLLSISPKEIKQGNTVSHRSHASVTIRISSGEGRSEHKVNLPEIGYASVAVGNYEAEVAEESSDSVRARVRYVPPTVNTEDSPVTALSDFGITDEDLKLFGFNSVSELGRSFIDIVEDPGDLGKAKVMLTDTYGVELQFKDVRKPYVILEATLSGQRGDVLQNTVYLEQDKPTVLGVTNLKDALILVLKNIDQKQAAVR